MVLIAPWSTAFPLRYRHSINNSDFFRAISNIKFQYILTILDRCAQITYFMVRPLHKVPRNVKFIVCAREIEILCAMEYRMKREYRIQVPWSFVFFTSRRSMVGKCDAFWCGFTVWWNQFGRFWSAQKDDRVGNTEQIAFERTGFWVLTKSMVHSGIFWIEHLKKCSNINSSEAVGSFQNGFDLVKENLTQFSSFYRIFFWHSKGYKCGAFPFCNFVVQFD